MNARKKLFIGRVLIFALILISTSLSAQSHKLAFSVTGGMVQDGFGGMANLDYKVNEFDHLQFNILAVFSQLEYEDIKVPSGLYAFNMGFFFDVLRNTNRKFALSIGGGGSIGFETINGGDKELENGLILLIENQMIYGVYAGADVDFFLSPVVTLNIKANEYYHINSDLGELSPYIGLGLKLILF